MSGAAAWWSGPWHSAYPPRVLWALNMALTQRELEHLATLPTEVIGAPKSLGYRCAQLEPRRSMARLVVPTGNAMDGSFVSMKAGLTKRHSFLSKPQACMAALTCIESWYDPWRRHNRPTILS